MPRSIPYQLIPDVSNSQNLVPALSPAWSSPRPYLDRPLPTSPLGFSLASFRYMHNGHLPIIARIAVHTLPCLASSVIDPFSAWSYLTTFMYLLEWAKTSTDITKPWRRETYKQVVARGEIDEEQENYLLGDYEGENISSASMSCTVRCHAGDVGMEWNAVCPANYFSCRSTSRHQENLFFFSFFMFSFCCYSCCSSSCCYSSSCC
jgi:hypothetical protein